PLLADLDGSNSIIVTSSADVDLAVGDIAASAFAHAGQAPRASKLVILVGSVVKSEQFRRQLTDAVTSMKIGEPHDPTVSMGPLLQPASGAALKALTVLAEGETWLVEPKQLDDSGRLWSPGVKDGVAPKSAFHLSAPAAPVLGIMHADTLDEAIALQNEPGTGQSAGIHSLDPAEISTGLNAAEAGNLFVNRRTTGALVERQPVGGWKASRVGSGAMAGGPDFLLALADWEPIFADPQGSVKITGVGEQVLAVVEAAQ